MVLGLWNGQRLAWGLRLLLADGILRRVEEQCFTSLPPFYRPWAERTPTRRRREQAARLFRQLVPEWLRQRCYEGLIRDGWLEGEEWLQSDTPLGLEQIYAQVGWPHALIAAKILATQHPFFDLRGRLSPAWIALYLRAIYEWRLRSVWYLRQVRKLQAAGYDIEIEELFSQRLAIWGDAGLPMEDLSLAAMTGRFLRATAGADAAPPNSLGYHPNWHDRSLLRCSPQDVPLEDQDAGFASGELPEAEARELNRRYLMVLEQNYVIHAFGRMGPEFDRVMYEALCRRRRPPEEVMAFLQRPECVIVWAETAWEYEDWMPENMF